MNIHMIIENHLPIKGSQVIWPSPGTHARYPGSTLLPGEGMVTEGPKKKGKKHLNCTPSKSRPYKPILM